MASWALRWVGSHENVKMILSGMSTMEQVQDNLATFTDFEPLNETEMAAVAKAKEILLSRVRNGCTGCRYCMPCPKGVDIPGIFRCYNAMFTEYKSQGRFQFAQTVGLTREPAFATQCIRCGKCEQHCPQSIPIRDKLREADKALRPLPYRIGIDLARKFMFRK
jgi:predicted aldo/keto reductase-like oxidoreductase